MVITKVRLITFLKTYLYKLRRMNTIKTALMDKFTSTYGRKLILEKGDVFQALDGDFVVRIVCKANIERFYIRNDRSLKVRLT